MAPHKSDPQPGDDLPPTPLGTIVPILRSVLGTSALALFEVSAGRIRCRYVDASLESRAERVWADHRTELLGGNTVHVAGAAYFPLVEDRVVGVLEAVGAADRTLDRFAMSLLMCTLRVLPEALRCCDEAAPDMAADMAFAADPEHAASEHADNEHVMRLALDELERQRLLALLDRHDWVVSAVARALAVDRVTVYRKMGKLGLRRPEPSPKAPRHGAGPDPLGLPVACG